MADALGVAEALGVAVARTEALGRAELVAAGVAEAEASGVATIVGSGVFVTVILSGDGEGVRVAVYLPRSQTK